MLRMQPDNHRFRLDIITNKKYILSPEKSKFEVQNPFFHIFCKIEFYIFFVIKYEPFGVEVSMKPFCNKQKWLDKIVYFNFLRN